MAAYSVTCFVLIGLQESATPTPYYSPSLLCPHTHTHVNLRTRVSIMMTAPSRYREHHEIAGDRRVHGGALWQ